MKEKAKIDCPCPKSRGRKPSISPQSRTREKRAGIQRPLNYLRYKPKPISPKSNAVRYHRCPE